MPARSDGGPAQTIAPGTTWVTEYDVTQRAITAWYHPHQMHLTGRHVAMGMAGLIVVEDEAAQVLPSTYGLDDLPLVIQDRRFAADGTHPYSPGRTLTQFDMIAGLKGDTMLVNGVVRPRGVVAQGLVRLRLLNGTRATYNLGFADDRSFLHNASDGGLLEAAAATTRVLVGPGERVELLVDFTADATGATVPLLSYSGGGLRRAVLRPDGLGHRRRAGSIELRARGPRAWRSARRLDHAASELRAHHAPDHTPPR